MTVRNRLRLLVLVLSLSSMGIGVANAQSLSLIPRTTWGSAPVPFLDACLNMDLWPAVGTATSYLGGIINDLSAGDSSSLSTCFSRMQAAGFKLTIEVAPFQPVANGCGTAAECYTWFAPQLANLQSLGAPVIRLRLQEPLSIGRMAGGWSVEDIEYETATFISLVRSNFTGIEITSVEAYPYNSAALLNEWMSGLTSACQDLGTQPPDQLEIDHDHNAGGSMTGLASMRLYAHSLGWSFSYIFGSPVYPYPTWASSAMAAGDDLRVAGIVPDLYTFESWENSDPWYTVPEFGPSTFMGTVDSFLYAGDFAGTVYRGGSGGTRILPDQYIYANEPVFSSNGECFLIYQGDGNLVLYRSSDWTALWHSGTWGTSVGFAVMQGDGNFVLYNANSVPVFATNTYGHPGAYMVVWDYFRLALYDTNGQTLFYR
jgi:hypothetical protein